MRTGAIFKEFSSTLKTGNRKGALFVLLYRIAHKIVYSNIICRIIGFPYLLLYHWIIRDLFSFDIHERSVIGFNFCVWHCFGIAVNPNVQIGENVIMRQNTTIGGDSHNVPIIGNNVEIGANVVIIGKTKIGDNVTIGAGSVVVRNIPNDVVVVGNPARIIKYKTNENIIHQC